MTDLQRRKTLSKKATGRASGSGAENGRSESANMSDSEQEKRVVATDIDAATATKIAALRTQIRESFGKIVMAMMILPRYRNHTLADLRHLVLEPLMRDRVAIAYPSKESEKKLHDMAGFAIWASVSDEVDNRIREQVITGTFPVRLKEEDWNSGEINWLLDVIAPDEKAATNVVANFKQIIGNGNLRLHPIIGRLINADALRNMGAEKVPAPSGINNGSAAIN